MYQSASYAGQKSKSVFLEMAEHSASAARLLNEAEASQPEHGTGQRPTVPFSWWDRLLEQLGRDRVRRLVAPLRYVAALGPRRSQLRTPHIES
jgi:hypothetical protein